MKLIDLLVKELPKRGGWPELAVCATQDKDGEVYFSKGATPEFGFVAWHDGDWCGNEFHTITATDYDTAIITRAQYETALAKNDGWIEWGGGECPVDGAAYVDVKLRGGHVVTKRRACALYWSHHTPTGDGEIMSYRLHRDINSLANDDRLEQDLNECIGQDVVTEWDGEGLPPVGCECEIKFIGDTPPSEWFSFKLIGMHDEIAIITLDGENTWRHISQLSPVKVKFRPLRTEEEKERESAINDIALLIGRGTFSQDAERIYDAISSGEIKVCNKGYK